MHPADLSEMEGANTRRTRSRRVSEENKQRVEGGATQPAHSSQQHQTFGSARYPCPRLHVGAQHAELHARRKTSLENRSAIPRRAVIARREPRGWGVSVSRAPTAHQLPSAHRYYTERCRPPRCRTWRRCQRSSLRVPSQPLFVGFREPSWLRWRRPPGGRWRGTRSPYLQASQALCQSSRRFRSARKQSSS